MKRIAALLTVHNRKVQTLRCLNNIFNSVGHEIEYHMDVYLTDDGCTDGTADAVRSEFPQVHIVHGDGNLFWNRGMHKAWVEASVREYDYFVWLNDDTYLYDNAILRLLSCSYIFSDSNIIIGSTCDTKGEGKVTYGGMDENKEQLFSNTEPLECYYMHGNIVLIPNAVFKKVGYNDSYYRHSLGDHDYGLMARKKDIKVILAPGFFGECDIHSSVAKWKDPKLSLRERHHFFYLPTGQNPFEFFHFRRKHYGLIPAIRTFITNYIHLLFPSMWKNDDFR